MSHLLAGSKLFVNFGSQKKECASPLDGMHVGNYLRKGNNNRRPFGLPGHRGILRTPSRDTIAHGNRVAGPRSVPDVAGVSRIATTISESTNRKHRPDPGQVDREGTSGRARREDLEAMTLLFGEDSPDALLDRRHAPRGATGTARSGRANESKTRTRKMTGLVLLALGLVLLVSDFPIVAVAGVLGRFMPLFLMMNVASVLCIALGVLLLPEASLRR